MKAIKELLKRIKKELTEIFSITDNMPKKGTKKAK
jgi:hypothetical protein